MIVCRCAKTHLNTVTAETSVVQFTDTTTEDRFAIARFSKRCSFSLNHQQVVKEFRQKAASHDVLLLGTE